MATRLTVKGLSASTRVSAAAGCCCVALACGAATQVKTSPLWVSTTEPRPPLATCASGLGLDLGLGLGLGLATRTPTHTATHLRERGLLREGEELWDEALGRLLGGRPVGSDAPREHLARLAQRRRVVEAARDRLARLGLGLELGLGLKLGLGLGLGSGVRG